jgi:drug/metabolite transporter (DMT)-like permease
VTIGDVVRVVLLFYLMPLWTVLLARLLLGERITGAALMRVALALVGVAWCCGRQAGLALPRALPDWLALMAGRLQLPRAVNARQRAFMATGAPRRHR